MKTFLQFTITFTDDSSAQLLNRQERQKATTLTGESGEDYEFEVHALDAYLGGSAVYAITRLVGDQHSILYFGQTENLQQRFKSHHRATASMTMELEALDPVAVAVRPATVVPIVGGRINCCRQTWRDSQRNWMPYSICW